jgi:NCAIR mutase (PurE)-related protein
MNPEDVEKLLEAVRKGSLSIAEAMDKLRILPFEDLGYAKIDTHRAIRTGFPEVIYCEGKTLDQIRGIVGRMLDHQTVILGMRADESVFNALKDLPVPVEYVREARAVVVGKRPGVRFPGIVLVVSAGTADIPVAEEAAVTAEIMGNRVERLYDVGVAGVHRLLSRKETLFSANVLVVTAGMEGALPSVVGGLVDKPVIAVPTSVGYGASFHGLSALLTMLSSCVPGIAVVNIDNGFGAGYLAGMINRLSGGKP